MKIIYLIILFFTLSLGLQSPTLAKCSIRALQNACMICEERAKSDLDLDSICPEVNCPSPSEACIKPSSFEPFLKKSYSLTLDLTGIENSYTSTIYITKNLEFPNIFSYSVRDTFFRPLIEDGTGFVFYDTVNFTLPLVVNRYLLSFNCFGIIDSKSLIKGYCSTVTYDEITRDRKMLGGLFTASPN